VSKRSRKKKPSGIIPTTDPREAERRQQLSAAENVHLGTVLSEERRNDERRAEDSAK